MDGNPWGASTWAEPEKEVVQEVTLKPKTTDTWLTSPASGDLGAAWGSSSQWDTKADTKSTWKSNFASEAAPWASAFEARAADVLGGEENSHSLEPTPVEETFQDQHDASPTSETSTKDRDAGIDEQAHPEIFAAEHEPADEEQKSTFTTPFESRAEESVDTWRALEHAAVIVGDDGPAWETAWKPDVSEEHVHDGDQAVPRDDWTQAIQEKVLRDARVPPEVMDTIFSRYTELEKSLWPDEDLEALREGPAPRPEWQGGLENVDGLAALVNRYLPPNDSAPPIHFETTKIATSFQNAMKLTKSYGIVQKSPLTRLVRTSESWAQSSQSGAGNSTAFSLESWLNRRGTSALSTNSPYFSTTLGAESQKTTARIIDRLSRSSIDRGKGISSTSTSPRVSQDGSPSILSVTAATTSSTAASPTNPSFSIESPASSAAPSAVTRFLSRFSRRAEDTPKQPAAVNLKPEELDFLDMMPAMNPNSPLGSAIQKELESTGKYSGQAIGIGSSIISTPSPSRQGMVSPMAMNKLSSTANLGQISSKDFDTLLDAQILEIEDEKMRESLVAAAMISAPIDSRYSTLSLPFFGSKAPEGAQPLGKEPGSATSNTLLDDDDFDAFLSSPTPSNQPAQKQKPQPAATFSLTPSLFSAQNSTPTSFRATSPPNMGILGSARPSPTPSRNPTMAIMSGGSRPATPTTMAIAPLLPPPPGSKPIKATRQGDLLNQSGLGSSHTTPTHSRTNSSSAMNGGKAAQMASLLTLSPPVANPVPSPMPLTASRVVTPSTAPATGGLSAQDLSFFEGL